MAENSIREQLLVSNKTLIESMGIFNSVKRCRLTHADLCNFAVTQFPVVAIVGGLPTPTPHQATRGVPKDVYIMNLEIQLYVYLQAMDDFDSDISSLADDLWRELNTDQSRNTLAFETLITPAKPIHLYAPYAGFQYLINHKYQTTTGGI